MEFHLGLAFLWVSNKSALSDSFNESNMIWNWVSFVSRNQIDIDISDGQLKDRQGVWARV